MRQLIRHLTGRCTACGQGLASGKAVSDRVAELNNRAIRLARGLGRTPRAQSCRGCGQMVLEGEPGFVENFLLIDMV